MPIAFARAEFVSRSNGKNACAKAAYSSRSVVKVDGKSSGDQLSYDYRNHGECVYHEVLLPSHVDEKFKDISALWNRIEQLENRKNSQLQHEIVVALPDDDVVSLEDRIELSRSFAEKHLLKKGLAVQINIHPPDKSESGKDLNWHAHILTPTRRFNETGDDFELKKSRDLFSDVRNGKVVNGQRWGELWRDHQNEYFISKGLDLRVDDNGVIPQIHLGPVRMRGRAIDLINLNESRIEENKKESLNPDNIIDLITEKKSVFTSVDVDHFIYKHVEPSQIQSIKEQFWKNPRLLDLYKKEDKKESLKFTSKEVVDEERKILRLSKRLNSGKGIFRVPDYHIEKSTYKDLSNEQKEAFFSILSNGRLSCVEGFAGTGKSRLLNSVKQAYESQSTIVRAFGPDESTVKALKESGITNATNIHKFLYSKHYGKVEVAKGDEIWIVDEAGKIGNLALLELIKEAEKNKVHLVLSGDSAQLPSVDRGGMFKVLSENFGSSKLKEIKRQQNIEHLKATKALSQGKIHEGIEHIEKFGGFVWASSKDESFSNLMEKWATDQQKKSDSTFLILAHKNSEVRKLNELVRTYRKEKGEISLEEFKCKTKYGNILVSKGDKIEFRKNDSSIGVRNGTLGTLVSIDKDKLRVRIQEEGKFSEVTFNPNAYASFHLGYATTNFRSQGRTIDRAYVLHSPMVNREMFYVGLTRHTKEVSYFLSKEEVSCIADLKRQVLRKAEKETTIDYQTFFEMKEDENQLDTFKKIEVLKNSSSSIDRIKGFGLQGWGILKEKATESFQKQQDRSINRGFYSYVDDDDSKHGGVEMFKESELKDLLRSSSGEKKSDKKSELNDLKKGSGFSSPQKDAWISLSNEKKEALSSYYKDSREASSFYQAVKSEAEACNIPKEQAEMFKEWQRFCSKRNESALKVFDLISLKERKNIFSEKNHQIIEDRANKAREYSIRNEKDSVESIECNLRDNVEGLAYTLFPEGPTGRDSKGLRFGNKGSFSVSLRGGYEGNFYDFEEGKGGGPIKLIQKTLNLNFREALKWSKEFLGKSDKISVPSHFSSKSFTEKTEDWIALIPEKNAPQLKEVRPNLEKYFKETARYNYQDEKGNLLFHTLRLVSRNDPNKKMVIPLSYGYFDGQKDPYWELKGYRPNNQPLYRLDLLEKSPNSKVLIVEGEKSTDAANALFKGKNIIAISWIGGSSSVSKSDWSPLKGRDVIIWPDNDKAGFEASNTLLKKLRSVGCQTIKEVDRNILSKEFPPKWDLADPLPEGKDNKFLSDVLLQSNERSVSLKQLFSSIRNKYYQENKDKAIEILSHIEEKQRVDLEKNQGLSPQKASEKILNEAITLIDGSRENTIGKMSREIGMQKEVIDKISHKSILFSIDKGHSPSKDWVENERKETSKIATQESKKEKNIEIQLSSNRDKQNSRGIEV
ncbi:AAA family ATPase [Chlamydiales bacterium]|nr:AAA family ATPase [Chlamydiales bacterium]